jgi:hypothetical protein
MTFTDFSSLFFGIRCLVL